MVRVTIPSTAACGFDLLFSAVASGDASLFCLLLSAPPALLTHVREELAARDGIRLHAALPELGEALACVRTWEQPCLAQADSSCRAALVSASTSLESAHTHSLSASRRPGVRFLESARTLSLSALRRPGVRFTGTAPTSTDRRLRRRLVLMCLPPLQGLAPDAGVAWGGRLSRLLARTALLGSLNAYVSTLGGGRFLCRHIGPALALAQLQARVARALGDPGCEARCWLHVAYSLVAAGRFRAARGLLSRLAAAARVHLPADEALAIAVGAACTTAQRTRELHASGELQRTTPSDAHAARHDEFHRQRPVHVRALHKWVQQGRGAVCRQLHVAGLAPGVSGAVRAGGE